MWGKSAAGYYDPTCMKQPGRQIYGSGGRLMTSWAGPVGQGVSDGE